MFLSVVSIILGSFVIGYVVGYGVRSVIAFYDRHELRENLRRIYSDGQ